MNKNRIKRHLTLDPRQEPIYTDWELPSMGDVFAAITEESIFFEWVAGSHHYHARFSMRTGVNIGYWVVKVAAQDIEPTDDELAAIEGLDTSDSPQGDE